MLDVRGVDLTDLAASLPRAAGRLDMRRQWIGRLSGDALIEPDAVMAPCAREIAARLASDGRAVGAPSGIAAGQAWECEPAADLAEYHRAKTGALFAGATLAGAAAAGADPAPWRELGERLGEAYQVADDIRDAAGDPDELGKPVGRDLELGRQSAVLTLGARAARSPGSTAWSGGRRFAPRLPRPARDARPHPRAGGPLPAQGPRPRRRLRRRAGPVRPVTLLAALFVIGARFERQISGVAVFGTAPRAAASAGLGRGERAGAHGQPGRGIAARVGRLAGQAVEAGQDDGALGRAQAAAEAGERGGRAVGEEAQPVHQVRRLPVRRGLGRRVVVGGLSRRRQAVGEA